MIFRVVLGFLIAAFVVVAVIIGRDAPVGCTKLSDAMPIFGRCQ